MKLEYEVIKQFAIHAIELLMLFSILIELGILFIKIIRKDKGKPLLIILMLMTISIRDFMLMAEGIKEMNTYVLTLEVIVIFVSFILLNMRHHFLEIKEE